MRDFPPRRESTGDPCSAVDCTDPVECIAMLHIRAPGEWHHPDQDDLTHVHFEVPMCTDHALLFRGRWGAMAHVETMRD